MRLHKLSINNFRKLKNCHIEFRDTTFLIGPNNAGKSSVFSALQYLHKNTNLDREDFSKVYSEDDDCYVYEDEVEVIAEYHNVPEEAHNWLGFKGRITPSIHSLDGESGYSITYKKVWSLNQSSPKIFMKEYPRARSDRYSQCTKVSDLLGEHYSEEFLKSHFGEGNFEKGLTIATTKSKFNDLPECWDVKLDEEPNWVENPGGIPGNVLSKLPRVVVIPAESCIHELTNSGGALLTLLGDLFEQVRSSSENYSKAQKFLNNLAAELDPNDETTDFGKLMNDLNGMVDNLFPDSAIHVNAKLDVPEKSIKPQFSVEMESNVKTAVSYQGHGMIRATVFQLLRYIQEYINRSSASSRATIFCFEEPEIYLHPAAANQMRDALYDLAGPNCQIIATTHSPYMINLGSEKSVSLTKFSLTDNSFSTSKSFNLEDAFLTLQNDEKQNLKMLLKVDDYISRIFFTKKSIFVEGDTEEVVFRETIKRLTPEDKARFIGNCEVLRARGKAVLISIAKYLNALGVDYIFMHDRDANTEKAAAMNAPILEHTGEQRRIMIEDCIEDLLGYAAPSSEKPYKAYQHIQMYWADNFNDLPGDWKSTFIRLCAPYLNHLN